VPHVTRFASGSLIKIARSRSVLELLIDKAPATVSREEVRCEVWGDDISIDVEQNLNYCIRQLALALGMSLQVRRCR
jgi:DNA-binding winged helix-turn-helix (wHTH) protein